MTGQHWASAESARATERSRQQLVPAALMHGPVAALARRALPLTTTRALLTLVLSNVDGAAAARGEKRTGTGISVGGWLRWPGCPRRLLPERCGDKDDVRAREDGHDPCESRHGPGLAVEPAVELVGVPLHSDVDVLVVAVVGSSISAPLRFCSSRYACAMARRVGRSADRAALLLTLLDVGDFVAEGVAELEEAFGQLVESGCKAPVVEDAVEQSLLLGVEFDGPCRADVLERPDDSLGAWRGSQFPEQVFPALPGQPDVVGFAASVHGDAYVVGTVGHGQQAT